MKPSDFWTTHCLFVEIGQSSFQALNSEDGLELPVERLDSGRLTPACKEQLASRLQSFLSQKPWRFRRPVWCAIGVRGVSLRRLNLPAASPEELQRVLLLQMESEFPLPPDALAWGYCQASQNGASRSGDARRELTVAALKREVIEDYREVLVKCGLSPVFTLGALARTTVCPPRPDKYTLLDLGKDHSELACVQAGTVTTVRVLPWGGEFITRAIQKRLGVPRDEAESLKVSAFKERTASETEQQVRTCFEMESEALAVLLRQQPIEPRVYLTGGAVRNNALLEVLTKTLGPTVQVERIEVGVGAGRSAATVGLKQMWERNGASPPLTFQIAEEKDQRALTKPVRWHWAALAILLLFASFSMRYAEAFLRQGRLSRRLAEISAYREGLPRIDRELNFLEYLDENEPPLLDALFVISKAAPGGTRLDFVSMNRRGDVSLRGMMQNGQQATDFRTKLIDSGFFGSVVLDEQAPTPDRQRITFRLTARWKAMAERPRLSAAADDTATKELQSGKSKATNATRAKP